MMTKRWIKWAARCVLTFATISVHAAHSLTGDQLQQQVVLALLLDQDEDRTRLSAKIIGQMYPGRADLMDCVAEMLNRSIGRPQVGMAVDVVAVYAAVLGKSRNPRYLTLLSTARRAKNVDKVNRAIDAALALVGKASVDQYQAGSIDIAERAAAVRQVLKDNRESNRSEFATTRASSELPGVLNVLGAPDDVSAITEFGTVGRRTMIVIHYYGQGLITFRMARDDSTSLVAFDIARETVTVDGYQGAQQWLAQAIVSLRGVQYRNLIRFHTDRWKGDAQIVSLLTRRLIVMDRFDDYEEDATEHLPQLLSTSTVPNEASMWVEASRNAKTRLVRKVADTRIKQLRKMKER